MILLQLNPELAAEVFRVIPARDKDELIAAIQSTSGTTMDEMVTIVLRTLGLTRVESEVEGPSLDS